MVSKFCVAVSQSQKVLTPFKIFIHLSNLNAFSSSLRILKLKPVWQDGKIMMLQSLAINDSEKWH